MTQAEMFTEEVLLYSHAGQSRFVTSLLPQSLNVVMFRL